MLDHTETARVFVTIPRSAPGTDGYPTTIFVRTGGGGDRPLVDRGVRGENGGPPLAPGTGPAQEFAQVGVAGISVDGPHGGVRNVTASDEQLLIFNITNPPAMRDNIRQSALELVLLANLVGDVSIDTSACPGAAQPATLDASRLAMMGHSMGATIGPLAVAVEPSIRALLLSGGQQKLVALARAIVAGTDLLLLDEPFEGVAPALAQRLSEVIGALRGEKLSVLIAQSDSNHSSKWLDREYTIERGASTEGASG